MIRVKKIVVWSFSGSGKKPGAMTRTMTGAKIIPKTVMRLKTISDKTRKTLTKFHNSALSFLASYCEKTGTNAELVAPSPTRSRNRLGMRKATKKAYAWH